MKKTILHNEHLKLGAKLVEFGGWEMPVMYSSIVGEHNATRTNAGLFDVSHMGEFRVKGKGAAALLEKMIPTSLDKLEPRKSMYSVFCKENGAVIDDLFIYMVSPQEYYLVVNAGTMGKDFSWLKNYALDDVELINETDQTAKIDIQGPCAEDILARIFSGKRLAELTRFYYNDFEYNGKQVMVSRSGYTGEAGFELYIPNDLAVGLWNELLDKGRDQGIKPAGLGARDSLRLESCYSLYGHELSESISPVEAGLGWLISSPHAYIGKNILKQQKEYGAPREIMAFELVAKGIPREGCAVYQNNEKLGYVTSGTFSPTFKKGIGLILVKSDSLKINDQFEVEIRNKKIPAKVVKKPIYTYNG